VGVWIEGEPRSDPIGTAAGYYPDGNVMWPLGLQILPRWHEGITRLNPTQLLWCAFNTIVWSRAK
jgi:hypothetical protein